MESHKTDMDKTMPGMIVFNNNHHFSYVYKKTEKLVTALYMITNFIKDNEPLKWRIRDRALELLSFNVSLNNVSLSDRKDLLKRHQAHSTEIVSLSSIARHAGLISEMNFEILRREFIALASIIDKDENKKVSEETVVLDSRFFDVPQAAPSTTEVATQARPQIESSLYKRQDVSVRAAQPQATPTVKDIPHQVPPTKKTESKNERQEAILGVLSNKSRLSVKDFADVITGVSEKTIQRELLLMVSMGVLKKEGERRWSTYSLA